MNIKLNNDESSSPENLESEGVTSAEDRRRTGRYVAIVVGISLVCLAMYHAWIRRVPVLASLLVPALIMLLYIAWVLYTASRDKRKGLNAEEDAEAGASAAVVQDASAEPANSATTSSGKLTSPQEFRRSYSIA